MNDRRFAALMVALVGLSPSFAGPASAHIVLSQTSFEAGQNYAAFFKVESGCEGSPTIALRVQIPQAVSVIDTPAKPGWTLNAERSNGRVTAVTWRGRLDAKTADQFGIFVKLPVKPETLYFPAVQSCEKGETRWADIPAAGQAPRDVAHPAPALQLVAAAAPVTPPPTPYLAGDIMIMQPWSPATPGGATTAAAYMMIMNHASTLDTLLGGTSPVGKLEIHQMTTTNGVMSMRPLPGGVPLPGAGILNFDPQGPYHLMLTGLKAPLIEGTRVPATLNFAKQGPVQIELSIAPIGARAPVTDQH